MKQYKINKNGKEYHIFAKDEVSAVKKLRDAEFEVGKTYTTKNGNEFTVTAIKEESNGYGKPETYVYYDFTNKTSGNHGSSKSTISFLRNSIKAKVKDYSAIQDESTYKLAFHNDKWYYEITNDDGSTKLVGPYSSAQEARVWFAKHRPNDKLQDKSVFSPETMASVQEGIEDNFASMRTRMSKMYDFDTPETLQDDRVMWEFWFTPENLKLYKTKYVREDGKIDYDKDKYTCEYKGRNVGTYSTLAQAQSKMKSLGLVKGDEMVMHGLDSNIKDSNYLSRLVGKDLDSALRILGGWWRLDSQNVNFNGGVYNFERPGTGKITIFTKNDENGKNIVTKIDEHIYRWGTYDSAIKDSKYEFDGTQFDIDELKEDATRYGLDVLWAGYGKTYFVKGRKEDIVKLLQEYNLATEIRNIKDSAIKDKIINAEARTPEDLKKIIQSWDDRDDGIRVKVWLTKNTYSDIYYYHDVNGYYVIPTGVASTTTEYTHDRAKETALKYASKIFDSKSVKDADNDYAIYTLQSDVDKNLTFYIGKKYALKDGMFTLIEYSLEKLNKSPQQLKNELLRNGWHEISNRPVSLSYHEKDQTLSLRNKDSAIKDDDFIQKIKNMSGRFLCAEEVLDIVEQCFGKYKWHNNPDGTMTVKVNTGTYNIKFEYGPYDERRRVTVKSVTRVGDANIKDDGNTIPKNAKKIEVTFKKDGEKLILEKMKYMGWSNVNKNEIYPNSLIDDYLKAGIATVRVLDSAIKDENIDKPKIPAQGKWEWDEVKQDWFDTERKMYYTEIVRNSGEKLGKYPMNDANFDTVTERKDLVRYSKEWYAWLRSVMEKRNLDYIWVKFTPTKFGKFEKSRLQDVEPNKDESKEDFIARFMSETKEEYPDEKQRYAVANSYWERRNLKDENIKGFPKKINRDGYIFYLDEKTVNYPFDGVAEYCGQGGRIVVNIREATAQAIKDANPLEEVRRDIEKAKQRLNGKPVRENFGQDEVRKLKEKYSQYQYGQYSEVFDLIDEFDNWCSNYTD